jgi:hypothetical protein
VQLFFISFCPWCLLIPAANQNALWADSARLAGILAEVFYELGSSGLGLFFLQKQGERTIHSHGNRQTGER